jgi:hypothetical protein
MHSYVIMSGVSSMLYFASSIFPPEIAATGAACFYYVLISYCCWGGTISISKCFLASSISSSVINSVISFLDSLGRLLACLSEKFTKFKVTSFKTFDSILMLAFYIFSKL